MSLYIEEMTLPHEDVEPMHLELYADGTVFFMKAPDDCYEFKAVPVPPHGRCIDADALIKSLSLDEDDAENGASLLMAIFIEVLKAAPTIIPAEEGET